MRDATFRALALATVAVVYLTIIAGAYVRGSGAGLGCPDWPTCHGNLLPPFDDRLAVIEWSHRTVAALAGFFILGTFLAALKYRRTDRRVMLAATVAFLLLPLQAGLGAATVLSELDPVLSATHMGIAAALFGAIVATAIFAHFPSRPTRAEEAEPAEGSFRREPPGRAPEGAAPPEGERA